MVCSRSQSGTLNHSITVKPQNNPKSVSNLATSNEYSAINKLNSPDQLDIEKLDKNITVVKQGLGAIGRY
jgi:hypothetical protein